MMMGVDLWMLAAVLVELGGSKVRRVGEGKIVDGINWSGVDAPQYAGAH